MLPISIPYSATMIRLETAQYQDAPGLKGDVLRYMAERGLYQKDDLPKLKTMMNPRRFQHTLGVRKEAVRLALIHHLPVQKIALAALLHDADDHKLFHTEQNANARSFLDRYQMEKTEEIIAAIRSVSFSQNRGKHPETLEGKIVQDADRLDAIGAVGIARAFAYGGERGRSLEATIAHFHEKLLLLKDEMNTEAAQRLAKKRHEVLVAFLEEFMAETEEAADGTGDSGDEAGK